MNERIKKYVLYAVLIAAGYFILTNHFIYVGSGKVRLLKKAKPELHYTFFSIENKRPESILKVDILRDAGIGGILVDTGLLTEEQMERLVEKIESE